jgi:hypothetical protein
MTVARVLRALTGLLVSAVFILSGNVMAQSTLFNIPSTDTVAARKAYAEFDFMAQIPGAESARTYFYNPRLVVGAPGNIEAGLNFPAYSTRASSGSATNVYIQPNAKWKFYNNDDAAVAAAAGGLGNLALNKRDSQDNWIMFYGLVSKKFKAGDYSPRFHIGPYGIASANQDPSKGPVSFLGPRAGVIAGYEQPVYKKLAFVADWFSGKNWFGYFTPGISIALPGNGLFNAGYSIGNDSWKDGNAAKNRYLFLYYGVTF